MSKKIIAIFIAAATLFSLCACGKTIDGLDFSNGKTETPTEINANVPMTGIELWSFNIGQDGDVSEFLEKYKDSGADYINFNVLWSSFEVEKDKYNWTFVDTVCDSIVNAGFKVGISFVVWTNGLSFKEEIETQKTADGESYAFDTSRKDFPSLTSETNKELIFDAASAIAVHFSERYKNDTVLFRVVTSPFGDSGYTAADDVDFSESAISEFIAYLSAKFQAPDAFCEKYPFAISDFSELADISPEKLAETCPYEWKTFKQKTLSDFYAEIIKIAKAALPSCPTELFFGGVEDTKTAIYRGFYDPYTVSRAVGADVYATSWETNVPTDFLASYLADTTGSKTGFTVYESDLSEESRKTLSDEVAKCSGILRVTFSFEEGTSENVAVIKEVSGSLKKQAATQTEKTALFLVNTTDIILRSPAKNLFESFREEYAANGGGIRFITDTELENLTDVGAVSEFITAVSGKTAYFTEKTAEKLIEWKIPVATDGKPTLCNEFGKPLNSETTDALAALFK